MKRDPIIFISYCQEYAELKDFVAQLLGDFGFRTEVFDYGSPHSVIDTEKELIETCDGFVALLTPDQETADGRHICSMSVNQEIGMAYQAGKPIQLFAFDHVDFTAVQASQVSTVAQVSTLSEFEEAVLAFDSKNLRDLVRALIEFRRRIRSLEGHKGDDAFFSYKTVTVRQDLISPTELRLHNTIEAVSLKNLDTHTHAARLLCGKEEGPGIRLRDDSWQFKLIRPSGVDATIRVTENTYSNFRFYIDFDPPIQAGAELKYAYRRRHENYIPYTAEELDALVSSENLSNRVMAKNKMIGQDFFVTQPTESVSFHLQFPSGYPIRNFKSLVCEYRGDQVHHSETERVSELAELDHNEFDDEYVLRMEGPEPSRKLLLLSSISPPTRTRHHSLMARLIVYGSLLHPREADQKDYPIQNPIPIWVSKYQRVFSQEPSWRPSKSKKRAVLNVERTVDKRFSAVLFDLNKGADLSDLDERERGYNRVEVPEGQIRLFSNESGVESSGPTFIYEGRPEKQNSLILPAPGYLEICLSGALQWGQNFYESFLDSTRVGDRTLRQFMKTNPEYVESMPS